MKLGIHKGSIVTEPFFEKRSRLGENGVNLLKNSFVYLLEKNAPRIFLIFVLNVYKNVLYNLVPLV